MRLLRAAAIGLVLFVLAALGIAWAGLSARPGDADAALVFGNTVEPGGQPSRRLAARLETARELYKAKRVRYILVSGGTGREGFDEAHVMGRYLAGCGVPDSALIEDSKGINTLATCRNARELLQAAARRAGLRVVGAQAPRFFEPRDVYSLAREVVALPVYALR